MIKATKQDKAVVINILVKSFSENQSVNYLVKKKGNRLKRIHALMDYSFEMCFLFGEVWLSKDRKGCALILFPHLKHTTVKSLLLDLKLIFKAIGINNILKAVRREARIKAKQTRRKMSYLWFIGVDPAFQHEGIGSNLINDIIFKSNEGQLPVFLETSTLKNLPWYKKFNFQTYDSVDLGYTLFFLKRELDKL